MVTKKKVIKKKAPKKKTRRDTMRDNNNIAREWLMKVGYRDIWLKMHSRFLDTIWKEKSSYGITKYKANDLWNCFDGIGWILGRCVFLAISDRFKGIDEIKEFMKDKKNVQVLIMKVHPKTKEITTKYLEN